MLATIWDTISIILFFCSSLLVFFFLSTDEVAKSATLLESAHEKINIPELLTLIGEKCHLWEKLAVQLTSNVDVIKRIKQDCDTCNSRLIEVIGCWKNHDHPPFTWVTIENVFRKINECSLANTIKRKYLTKNHSE